MGVTPSADPLRSHEILQRVSPGTKVLGPLMESAGLEIHEEYWPNHPEDVGRS
jgi:hypothetical protein